MGAKHHDAHFGRKDVGFLVTSQVMAWHLMTVEGCIWTLLDGLSVSFAYLRGQIGGG